MSLVDHYLFRSLMKIRGRMLALALIIAAGVGIFFGVNLALSNIDSTQRTLLDQMGVAEFEVQLLPEDDQNLPDLSNIPGVETLETRLIFPGHVELADGQPLNVLLIFQDRPQPRLNRLQVQQGRLFTPGAGEVVIDRSLAQYHHYAVGDRIQVKVGNKVTDRLIVGIVMSAEFLVTASNPEYVVSEPGSMGVVWTDPLELRETLGFSMVNSLLFHTRPGVTRAQGSEAITQAVRRLNIERIVPREEAYSTRFMQMEITGYRVYSPAIIVILLVLSIAMGVITFRRFAVEKQREVAGLLALGVSSRVILRALLRVGLGLGLCGGLLGLGMGVGLGRAMASVYAEAMMLPLVIHRFDALLALQSLLLGLLCGTLSVVVAFRSLLRAMPGELLSGQVHRLATVRLRLGGLPTLMRLALRDVLRQRELCLCAVLAIGGAVGVAISYGLAMTSNYSTVGEGFQKDSWDYAIDFRYPQYADEAETLLGDHEMQPYLRNVTELRFAGQHAIAILHGIVPGRLHPLLPSQGRSVAQRGEAVLSYDLMRLLQAQIGDNVTLERGSETLTVTVVGVTNDIFIGTVSVALEDAQALAQFPEKVSGYFVRGGPEVRQQLINEETVARATDRIEVQASLARQMKKKMGIVYIVIAFALGVSALFVTTLLYLSIAERRGEYAILRSLGFSAARLRAMILYGTGAQLLLGLLLSVPVGLLLVKVLNARMGEAWYAVDEYYSAMDFALPMLCSLVIVPIACLKAVRAILQLNIPDYLRGRAL